MNEVRTERLGTDNIIRLLKDLSLPAIFGMIVNATYNVVDGIFIGRGVGSDALAGITVAFPIQMISFAIIIMIATGGSAMFSIYLGKRDEESASICVNNSYSVLLLMLGLFISAVLVFKEPVLIAFGGRGEVLRNAMIYISALLPFHIFLGYQVLLENFTRAEGNSRIAMTAIVTSSILNIILDYIFIFIFDLGVRGAAIATGISHIMGMMYLFIYVTGKSDRLRLNKKNLKINKKITREIFSIGFSSFARQTTFSFQALILNNLVLSYGGDLSLAILGVLSRVFSFLVLPVFGIIQGMRPLISFNYGAKKYKRAKETIKYSIIGATGFLFLGFLLVQIFPNAIIGAFTTDVNLISEGARVLRIVTIVFPIISIQMVGSAAFQSLERPVLALVFSVIRQILIFIPLLLILPAYFGIDGVWWTYPVADILAMLATGVFLIREVKKMKNI